MVEPEDKIARLRDALIRAGKHINQLRDEHSERDTTKDPLPAYIIEALAGTRIDVT